MLKEEALLACIACKEASIDNRMVDIRHILDSRKRWKTKHQQITEKANELNQSEINPLERAYAGELLRHTSRNRALCREESTELKDCIEDSLFEVLLRPPSGPPEPDAGTRLADTLREEAEKGTSNKFKFLTNVYTGLGQEAPIREELLEIGKVMNSRQRWYTRFEKIDSILDAAARGGDLNEHERTYISNAIENLSKNRAIKNSEELKVWANSTKKRLAALAGEEYEKYACEADAVGLVDDKLRELKQEKDMVRAAEQAERIFTTYGYLKEATSLNAPLTERAGLASKYRAIERNFEAILLKEKETLINTSLKAKEKNIPNLQYDAYGLPVVDRQNYARVSGIIAEQSRMIRRGKISLISAALAFLLGIALTSGNVESTTAKSILAGPNRLQCAVESVYTRPGIATPLPEKESDEDFCSRKVTGPASTANITAVAPEELDEIIGRCFTGDNGKYIKTTAVEGGKLLSFSPLGNVPFRVISGFNHLRRSEPLLVGDNEEVIICYPRCEARLDENGRPSCYSRHLGLDIVAKDRAPKKVNIYTMMPGKVVLLGKGGDKAGTYAAVEHNLPDGTTLTTKYLHLERFSPEFEEIYAKRAGKRGRLVSFRRGHGPTVLPYEMGGRELGVMGATGNAKGMHLHLETKHNGKLVDPTRYLPEKIYDAPAHIVSPEGSEAEKKNTVTMLDEAA
ncbi:M23 family metallopeptidase [Candidatus Woesearchaeota archaeon]|nr:M23 family metallopeptidase [Candidatus Woesearchaeota archaeon]